jgi:hypothetical protein
MRRSTSRLVASLPLLWETSRLCPQPEFDQLRNRLRFRVLFLSTGVMKCHGRKLMAFRNACEMASVPN